MSGDRSEATNRHPLVIGVAGGTGSGKTTVVEKLLEDLGPETACRLQQDSYYRDQAHRPFEERVGVNYDHPDSIEFDLMVAHVDKLLAGEPVDVPSYDFARHVRKPDSERLEAGKIIIVEGILVLVPERLRALMDLRIFVHTDADVRFIRRLRRDISERGRTVNSVIEQYLTTVKPMHDAFVEPSKRHAHLIIPEGGRNRQAIDVLAARIKGWI